MNIFLTDALFFFFAFFDAEILYRLDEQMIESLFRYNLQSSVKNEEAKSKNPSPRKHVMDNKRLQNITILMKAVNATVEQVCDALIQGW